MSTDAAYRTTCRLEHAPHGRGRGTAPFDDRPHLVERCFDELTERQLHRLAVTSVGELIEHITRYIDRRNINPKPFVCTASVRQILKKVCKANKTLATLH